MTDIKNMKKNLKKVKEFCHVRNSSYLCKKFRIMKYKVLIEKVITRVLEYDEEDCESVEDAKQAAIGYYQDDYDAFDETFDEDTISSVERVKSVEIID